MNTMKALLPLLALFALMHQGISQETETEKETMKLYGRTIIDANGVDEAIGNTKVSVIHKGEVVQEQTTDASGAFSFQLDYQTDYSVEFSANQYHTKSLDINTNVPYNAKKSDLEFYIDLTMKPVKEGVETKTFLAGRIVFSKENAVFVGKPAN